MPPPSAAAAALPGVDDRARVGQAHFLTGVQALAWLPMLQRQRDRAAGLNTAGYVTGYRGSPLGGLDAALHEARERLAAHDVLFRPAVNEDLAATAVWGTQQLGLFGPARAQAIFALWYGKGPGVDRSVDVFKHANHAGTARHGGVLVVAGDDHAARSSAVAHQSEHVFSACAMPVLAPAGTQDIVDFGLAGWALSRHAGLWVALKLAADVVESSAVVTLPAPQQRFVEPQDLPLPPGGLHIRWPDPPTVQEHRMQAWKIYAALSWVRANGINRVVVEAPAARLGIVAGGKAYADLREAMRLLGLDDTRAAGLGLRVMKVGMPWPLEAEGVRRFAAGLVEILVVEEKRPIIEYQLKEMLYERPDGQRPRVLGKFDEAGEWPSPHAPWLLPPTAELTPPLVARALASRLAHHDPAGGWAHAAARFATPALPLLERQRTPYFCPGCPHSRSTQVPEGSCALAGVGCHLMAVGMERRTLTISQMGGEGATWIGMAAHAGLRHVFANMGDGTYFHSGLLAIRASVAAGVAITYKILYNDAVAMTGGQPVDGPLTVPRMTRQLAAEGVARIVVIADDPAKYAAAAAADRLAPGVPVLPRERLEAVQCELRELPGTTVLIYGQVCATEARRRRKRGTMAPPARQVVIHEALCEGCGDCGIKSNCLAIVPVASADGRKRAIDAFTCNADLSCLAGECPALLSVEGATPRRAQGLPVDEAGLPAPEPLALDAPWSLLVAGVGGTGVVTTGALLGMAAHLDGLGVTVLDQTGLSQKGGAVLTHVRMARDPRSLHAPRIATADVLLGCDLLVACGAETLSRLTPGRTRAVVNSADAITGDFVRHPELAFPHQAALAALGERLGGIEVVGERAGEDPDEGPGEHPGERVGAGPAPCSPGRDAGRDRAGPGACAFDATALATRLAGHSIATNMLLLGYAWQRGWVPVSRESIARAVQLNGVAVEDNERAFAWGRRLAVDARAPSAPAETLAAAAGAAAAAAPVAADLLATQAAALAASHGRAAAARFLSLVERVRAAEARALPGSDRLTTAVARVARRLYGPKDDYEVARLLTDPGFEAALARRFDGALRLHYHLAPPWRRQAGADSGRAKGDYGPWLRPLLRALAAARVLRGSRLDPLRGSAERRLDADLRDAYEAAIERLLPALSAATLDAALAVASLPDGARGFGSVKAGRAAQVMQQLAAGRTARGP